MRIIRAVQPRFVRGGIAALAVMTLGLALAPSSRAGSLRAIQQPAADDWSMFHKDPLHTGVSSDTAVGASAASSGLALNWEVATGSTIESSPAVAYDNTLGETLVYVQTWDNALLALNAATGATVWTYVEPGPLGADSSPAVYDGVVYVGGQGNYTLSAVDATTGTLDCSFYAGGRIVASPIVTDLGSGPEVFFGDTGLHEKHNNGHEWAITGVGNSLGGCQLLWSYNHWKFTDHGADGGSWSPPALAYDASQPPRPLLIFGSNQPDNSVYALNAATGRLVWRYRTATSGDLDVGAGASITAPAVNGFADGEAYIDGKNGVLYAFDLTTGTVTWSFNMLAAAGATRKFTAVSTPAVVGGTVYVGYGYGMWAFDAVSGTELWYSGATNPVGKVVSSPAIAGAAGDQVIYSNDIGGHITAYQASDGAVLWQFTTAQPIYASDAVSDSEVFFGGIDGNVYAFGP